MNFKPIAATFLTSLWVCPVARADDLLDPPANGVKDPAAIERGMMLDAFQMREKMPGFLGPERGGTSTTGSVMWQMPDPTQMTLDGPYGDGHVVPANGFRTLREEFDSLWRRLRVVHAYVAPSMGTPKAEVEKVYGSRCREGGGLGPRYLAYPLGQPDFELRVVFSGDNVRHSYPGERYATENYGPFGPPLEECVSSARSNLRKLRQVVVYYGDKLKLAAWNRGRSAEADVLRALSDNPDSGTAAPAAKSSPPPDPRLRPQE